MAEAIHSFGSLPASVGERLRPLIEQLERWVPRPLEEAELLSQLRPHLAMLVERDDWWPAAYARAGEDRYRQYPLHVDPEGRFSVVAFVWGPGQATPIHDHLVWGLIGMLRGAEYSQGYRFAGPGQLLPDGPPVRLSPGQVEAVSPRLGDIHQVRNAYVDEVSISIHVYGADIGRAERHTYDVQGTRSPFVSGYSPLPLAERTADEVRGVLLRREEIALIDVRDEHSYAQAHPLWAANLPAPRLELDAGRRLPRRQVPIVVYDDGEGLAEDAAHRLQRLGYTDVTLLAGGLQGWRDADLELFRDVNVPSKAFGELVEAKRHTPSLSAPEVLALLEQRANVVVLDARRFDEYRTMSIPGGISVPGGELVRRARDLAPDPSTQIIVNCAGRTRSIIGAQSLINAGVPNPVAALRNGTIGWTLAGQSLAHGQSKRHEDLPAGDGFEARVAAAALARRAGARRIDVAQLNDWLADERRTTYCFDVRGAAEYEGGHRPGFRHAPGGQLVQETDHHAPVRGARLVLTDDDGVRAAMAASWLAQMGWEVALLPPDPDAHTDTGPEPLARPPLDAAATFAAIAAAEAATVAGRYRRPYEGTDNPKEAMQAYLDWEFGLVDQLARDGTHFFKVLGE